MELEQAKEELEMLETLYPNQHDYLKHELRSFISHLQNSYSYSHPLPQNNTSLTAFLDTEESTSLEHIKSIQLALPEREEVMKEGKKGAENSELESPKSVVIKHCPSRRKNKRKDRVDLVLEKAQNCLKKIRHFKTSLFSPS
ncbi:hypothetical protein MtrunA17_Chr3g0109201 [Medicago truncatula]|uniref:Uncharacterized protein n=1 Tax=Medicago truncatula TaxID=3880 RepID=A0A072UYA4_MEDTR|nr:uncharacterized protein LOC25489197 [Medicago truncatula]KEH34567.1 hypothetical protein MTR_3g063340 [Medicago truncatula]RHN68020.1 hypothetical protein MtrunA17_Chr3g0109201 [Medicago truncatula]